MINRTVKRSIVVFSILCLGLNAGAQSELTLPFMHNLFQSTYLNPTLRSEHSLSIGLPGVSSVYFQVIHNGFVPGSFLEIDGRTLIVSPDKLEDQLRNRNMLHANAGFELFHLKMRIDNWNFWYAGRMNGEMNLFYPKSLFSLAIEGNTQYSGKAMDLAPLGINTSLYREHTFGASTERDQWTFGGRASFLFGLTNIYLNPKQFEVRFDDDMYALSAVSDVTLRTSGIPGDSLSNVNFEQFSDFNSTLKYFTRSRNPGFALSGGVSYDFDSRTRFTFAFSNLGFISWSDSTKVLDLKGGADFAGFDILTELLAGNEINADTLIQEFTGNFESSETAEVRYSTWLAPRFYLAADYQLAARTQVGVHLYSVINRGFYPALSVGITQGVGRALNLALSVSANQRTISNIGFGMIIKPGPFQIYLLADNLYTPIVDPFTFTNLNLRVGMNLVFGRVTPVQGLPYR